MLHAVAAAVKNTRNVAGQKALVLLQLQRSKKQEQSQLLQVITAMICWPQLRALP